MNGEVVVSVAVGNVCNNPPMPQQHVEADLWELHHMARVVLACEIGKPRYDRAFREAAKAVGRQTFFEKSAVQVSVPQLWKTRGSKYKLSSGLKGVNPSRWMNVVYDETDKVAYAAIHLTNGAWNEKRKPFKKWRQRTWNKQVAKAAGITACLHRCGWTVVIGGDMNRSEAPVFHRRQINVAHAGSIMHLLMVPAPSVEVEVHDRDTRRGYTDHPFIRATLILHSKKETAR